MQTPNSRPTSVTVLAWLFLAIGVGALMHHATKFDRFDFNAVLISAVQLAAVVAGVFMLRGHNWARWLLVLWMAFHVVISGFDAMQKLIAHALMMAVICYFLFQPRASAYFQRAQNSDNR